MDDHYKSELQVEVVFYIDHEQTARLFLAEPTKQDNYAQEAKTRGRAMAASRSSMLCHGSAASLCLLAIVVLSSGFSTLSLDFLY